MIAKATLKIVEHVALPVIQLGPDIDEVADEAERALIASGLPIYQRGAFLVRPGSLPVAAADERETVSPAFKRLNVHSLRDYMSRAMDFQRYDKREKKWLSCPPPSDIAEIILSRSGEWKFLAIAGIISTPTLRPDGSLLTKAGYDKATRLYHVPDKNLNLPEIPRYPTKAEALESLKLIDELLNGFPFSSAVDRSVALSAILTAVGRGGFKACPLHAFSAIEAGTGKSFLCDLIAAFITGRWCPVIATGSEQELDKRLDSLLLAGLPIVSIDNVIGPLTSTGRLNQAVERPVVGIRLFNTLDYVETETRTVFLATGNNLVIVGEMVRRVLRSLMDAGMERPETRNFTSNPVKVVAADRGKYVAIAGRRSERIQWVGL